MRKLLLVAATAMIGCGDDGRTDASATGTATTTATTPTSTTPGTGSATTDDPTSTGSSSAGTATGATASTGAPGSTGAVGCGACSEPNQQCIDDVCVTSCQGQDPDPCGPAQVCDVISGTCKDAGAACTLAGATETCGGKTCGPGSVCDGVGECLAVAPCRATTCTGDGACWGSACSCERGVTCDDPTADLLNGPFSADIVGIDFADDCTAWAVTLSGGQEFLRRLTPAGEVAVWGGINDYDQGEVRVLRSLTIPQLHDPPPVSGAHESRHHAPALQDAPDPSAAEGLGEVALTYICCPTCGSCNNNPTARGVARLAEDDPNMPLPIVIYAEPTQGTGPFGQMHLDGGPQGLTWGEDRVLYVGNTTANGDYNTADLESGTVEVVYSFDARVTASAPVSPVHVLVALIGGQLYLFNTQTKQAEPVVDLMADITSLSHDPFTGDVYAALSDLKVVRVAWQTGEVEDFAMMPVKGRVAVSPSGQLWFTPVKYLNAGTLMSWPLPTSF